MSRTAGRIRISCTRSPIASATSRFSVAHSPDEGAGRLESAWDKRVWSLADAVVRGSHVDWTKESTEIVADERRQVLLELQALERLMQVHGAPSIPRRRI